jgi:hypothetical protein
MNNQANGGAIYDVVRQWQDAGTLEADAYDGELAYFRDRYSSRESSLTTSRISICGRPIIRS